MINKIKPMRGILDTIESSVVKGSAVLVVGVGIEIYVAELAASGYDVTQLDRCHGLTTDSGVECTSIDEITQEEQAAAYQRRTFDCILLVNSLSTYESREAFVGECYTRLGPSGRLIVVESHNKLGTEIIADRSRTTDERDASGGWSLEDLRSLVEAAGFRTDAVLARHRENVDRVVIAIKPRYRFEMDGYRFISAETVDDLKKVWRLRYEVYCQELHIETENPLGELTDEFDEFSIQLLAVDGSNRAVGTLRMVSDGPKGLPIEADYPVRTYMEAHGIRMAAEAGRFVIPKRVARECRGLVAFGLFKLLNDCCRENDIYDLFGATHAKIFEKYRMTGFKQIGEPFKYTGPMSGILWVPLHIEVQPVADRTLGQRFTEDSLT